MAEVISLAEQRRLRGDVPRATHPVADGEHCKIGVALDGTICWDQRLESGSTALMRFSPEAAQRMAYILLRAAATGREVQARLRGATRWRCAPAPYGHVWVEHRDQRRLFGPFQVGHRRHPARCVSCSAPIAQGDRAYRELPSRVEERAWDRDVAICRRCAHGESGDG